MRKNKISPMLQWRISGFIKHYFSEIRHKFFMHRLHRHVDANALLIEKVALDEYLEKIKNEREAIEKGPGDKLQFPRLLVLNEIEGTIEWIRHNVIIALHFCKTPLKKAENVEP